MKQILSVFACASTLLLGACSVNPSVLGNNVAGIGGAKKSLTTQHPEANALVNDPVEPASTGSIVPLNGEGAVVDLPDSGSKASDQTKEQANNNDQVQLSSSQRDAAQLDGVLFGQPVEEPEQSLSAEERYRRELINRGDLQEGQPLPSE